AVRRRQQTGLHRRGDQRLQVAPPELGIGILAGDDLALLRDANGTVHAPGGLREDGLVAWSSAATNRSAAAVKEPKLDVASVARLDQLRFRAVERPVGGDETAVLVAV